MRGAAALAALAAAAGLTAWQPAPAPSSAVGAVATASSAPAAPATRSSGADARRSGAADMSAATQALQRDDALNPGWLWLKDGEQRFAADCSRCHAGRDAMRGVAARHPAFDTASARPVTLGDRIEMCRTRRAGLPPLPPESDERLALEAFVGHASRGLPLALPADPRLAPFIAQGRMLYGQRMGQLDFSCAQCHDQHAGGRLAGSVIPQAHPTGYPIYRLEWQGMGSLQRRLRNCMTGVRAEPFDYGAPEFVALELYLRQRAAGMPVETPAVRP